MAHIHFIAHEGAHSADELAGLIRLSSDGCHTSFEEVYRRTCVRLLGIILRVNGDRAQAEDVLQETYIKIWLLSKQFDPARGEANHWMGRIAANGAIDSLRHQEARPKRDAGLSGDHSEPYATLRAPDAGPLEVLVSRRRAAAVQRCLRALPSDARDSLTLAFYDGLTYEEVAAYRGRPIGTVKSWVRRSFLALRAKLDGE